MTCWIEKSSVRQGPFSEDQIAQRVRLGLLGSLDRISIDGARWTYLRDTTFWKPVRTLSESPAAAAAVPNRSEPAPAPRAAQISQEVLSKFIKPSWMEV